MTDERVALLELIEKGADADLVRELLAFASDRLPPGSADPGCFAVGLAPLLRARTVEIDQLTGAAPGARSPDRVNYRNGYPERGWETRVGRIELAIPKLRPSPSADGVACGKSDDPSPDGSWLLFSSFPRAAAHRREGADCGHP